jgi:hypothetical protein
MTVHLPTDIERSIQAAVQGGRFASVDDAMLAAAHHPLGLPILQPLWQVQPRLSLAIEVRIVLLLPEP